MMDRLKTAYPTNTTFCGGITKIKWWHQFFEANWQLTLHSVVRSDQNSYSSKLLCIISLPVSMKMIGSKTAEKKWRNHLSIFRFMGAFLTFYGS